MSVVHIIGADAVYRLIVNHVVSYLALSNRSWKLSVVHIYGADAVHRLIVNRVIMFIL